MTTSQDPESNPSDEGEFLARLSAFVGKPGSSRDARDPVNPPMIRHWCDAMSDFNPVYLDTDFASQSIHGGLVAPPSMLNSWDMQGLVPRPPSSSSEPSSSLYGLLDRAGYTSVVATNSEHDYVRYLRPGDLLISSGCVAEVSAEKQTGLGIGHFVTTVTEYRDQDGEIVGRMKFRILKFKPGTGRLQPATGGSDSPTSAQGPQRPVPGISLDTAFFWDGVEQGELRIQECAECQTLHHPPVVRCPACGSYEFGYRVSSGRGTVYSLVEIHHPRVPAFDYPLIVALIDLEEGTRLVSNVIDIAPERVEIGMPVELACKVENSAMPLPLFRPGRPPRRPTTLRFGDVRMGLELAPCPIPITPTLIVAGAMASRDYQDVHHDRDLAIKRGSPNIFMNIMTTCGLSSRYVTDWTGPEARIRGLRIRLGAPNYPGDTMTMTGSVTRLDEAGAAAESGVLEVSFTGANHIGDHVTGSIELELPK